MKPEELKKIQFPQQNNLSNQNHVQMSFTSLKVLVNTQKG